MDIEVIRKKEKVSKGQQHQLHRPLGNAEVIFSPKY